MFDVIKKFFSSDVKKPTQEEGSSDAEVIAKMINKNDTYLAGFKMLNSEIRTDIAQDEINETRSAEMDRWVESLKQEGRGF
jgi:hypothetical protein